MNVLITGVNGFVGSHLAEALKEIPGVSMSGTIRSAAETAAPGIATFPVEIADAGRLREVIREIRPDRVFHLAAQAFVPTSYENPSETFRTNFQGTLNLLEAVRLESPAASVLIVSSGEVYGGVPRERLPIDESFPLHPENPYAITKACADLAAQRYRESFGVRAVVARTFNHIGAGQSDLFVASALARQIAEIKRGLRPPTLAVGNLSPERDFTDVRDVVRAYIALLEKPRTESVFNVCSGTAIPVRDILNLLCELAQVKVDIVPDPKRMRPNDIPVIIGDAGRLRSATGWSPRVPLRTTLRDLLDWWEARVSRDK